MADAFARVWAIVQLIPPGRVCTYGVIAKAVGIQGGFGARIVGQAMAGCPETVPAHRVVRSDGGVPEMNRDQLAAEGVPLVDGRVDLSRYFWTPGGVHPDDAPPPWA